MEKRRQLLLSLLLVSVLTAIVYLPSLRNGFTNWDDQIYVLHNPLIRDISPGGMLKIWTTFQFMGNYHPLTLSSLAVDYNFYRLDPFGYHLTNLLLHICSTSLVLVMVYMLLGNLYAAVLTAILFGIHPMHVEAVAWISARKEVLYSLFYMGALISHLKYTGGLEKRYYFIALILFCLSLLAKATAASLPLVLLAIDWFTDRKFSKSVIFEKIPFLILAVSFGAAAFLAQEASSSVGIAGIYSVPERISIAAYGFVVYIAKLLVPVNLSPFYSYPDGANVFLSAPYLIYPALALLIAVAGVISMKYTKKIAFGMLFFILTISPLLQFIPVGRAVMADRYSYIPSIGLFFVVAFWIYQIMNNFRKLSSYLTVSLYILLLCYAGWLSAETWVRCGIWKDGTTLWTDIIEKEGDNPAYYNNRGKAYLESGNYENALNDFGKSIGLDPGFSDAYVSRGVLHLARNNYEYALSDFSYAVAGDPRNALALYNRGFALASLEKYSEAVESYTGAINIKRDYSEAYVNRGVALFQLGDKTGACTDLRYALKVLGFEPALEFYNQYCK